MPGPGTGRRSRSETVRFQTPSQFSPTNTGLLWTLYNLTGS